MNQQKLRNVLELHRKWVLGERGGSRANLRGANLRDADLRNADLRDADLRAADLSYANLRGANLRGANLCCADLRYANLRSADLNYANLRGANLRDADLCDADLRYANLREIKEDFFKKLTLVKSESLGLYDFIVRGKVDGSCYQGECACFVGTIANICGQNYKSLSSGLKPDSNSLTERWFLGISKGDTPSNNPISKITSEWLEEFMNQNGIEVPKYRLVSSVEMPELFNQMKADLSKEGAE